MNKRTVIVLALLAAAFWNSEIFRIRLAKHVQQPDRTVCGPPASIEDNPEPLGP